MKSTNREYIKLLNSVKERLKKSQESEKPYSHEVCGEEIIVMPGVFSPKYFTPPEFFINAIVDHYRPVESFLEIGTGTGVLSCILAKKGFCSNIVATDITEDAVKNAKQNVLFHGLENQVEVLQGDIYKPVEGRKFDMIFWNIPFGCPDQGAFISELEQSVFDPGGRNLAQYIFGANQHLNKNGALLLGYSVNIGDFDIFTTSCHQADKYFMEIEETELMHDKPPTKIHVSFYEIRKK